MKCKSEIVILNPFSFFFLFSFFFIGINTHGNQKSRITAFMSRNSMNMNHSQWCGRGKGEGGSKTFNSKYGLCHCI